MSIKLIQTKNEINLSSNIFKPKEAPKNYVNKKLNDGKKGSPTSIWYNPQNGKINVDYDKATGVYTLSGNTDSIFINGAENGSKLIVKDGKNVQFNSKGGKNNLVFDNCMGTKAYGNRGIDNFTYIDGRDNINYNMNIKEDTVINKSQSFELFSPNTWFSSRSENLKTYVNDGF